MGVYDIRAVQNGTLRCSKCGEYKGDDQFHISRDKKNTSGRVYHCKQCVARTQVKRNMTEVGYKANLWQNLLSNAKRRNIPVRIEKADIQRMYDAQGGLCAVTGLPMQFSALESGKNSYAVSVDRIDSSRGYYQDNIRLVCARVNLMKMELSDEQTKFWCRAILKGTET